LGKAEVGGQMVWNWHESGIHDFSDAMAQGYAAAAFYGIGTGGNATRQIRRLPARRSKR